LQASLVGGARLPQADYVGYLRCLERMLILALASFGLDSHQEESLTGVWVHKPAGGSPPCLAKIAAIGVKVNAHGISLHGFALNVSPDMSYWQGIVGCGLVGYAVASMAELIYPPPGMDAVSQAVTNSFGEIFQYEIVESPHGPARSV
jgi:lipoate-protein ligase B